MNKVLTEQDGSSENILPKTMALEANEDVETKLYLKIETLLNNGHSLFKFLGGCQAQDVQ